MEPTRTPALQHLLGAYFHQDWFDEYGNEDAAVDAFVAESQSHAPRLSGEVDWALASYPDESDLEQYLDTLGCEYVPRGSVTYRGWLTAIADRVRTTMGGP